jgi:hypothetical protein
LPEGLRLPLELIDSRSFANGVEYVGYRTAG